MLNAPVQRRRADLGAFAIYLSPSARTGYALARILETEEAISLSAWDMKLALQMSDIRLLHFRSATIIDHSLLAAGIHIQSVRPHRAPSCNWR